MSRSRVLFLLCLLTVGMMLLWTIEEGVDPETNASKSMLTSLSLAMSETSAAAHGNTADDKMSASWRNDQEQVGSTPLTISLTQQQVNEYTQTLSHTIVNMSFTGDRVFAKGFSLNFLPEYKSPCWREGSLGKGANDGRNDNGTLWCMPYFFIGGFPKSGSQELFAKLLMHQQISGHAKGGHWWTRDRYSRPSNAFQTYKGYVKQSITKIRDTVDGQGYHRQVLIGNNPSMVWDNRLLFSQIGTADPDYLQLHVVRTVLPDAKFVLIIRNPVMRLYSDYLFFRNFQSTTIYSPTIFHKQVVTAIQDFNNCTANPQTSFLHCIYGNYYQLTGRLRLAFYSVHITVLLQIYPRENVFVLKLEDYMEDRAGWLRKVMVFLDIDVLSVNAIKELISSQPAQNTNKEAYVKVGPMLEKTKMLLEEFYRPFNAELRLLLKDINIDY